MGDLCRPEDACLLDSGRAETHYDFGNPTGWEATPKETTVKTYSFALLLASALSLIALPIRSNAADLYASSAGQGGTGELYIINPATGATITDVGPLNDSTGRNFGMTGLAFDPVSGVLYGSSAHGNTDQTTRDQLVTINPATGLVTPIGVYTTPDGSMTDIAFDPNTHILYGIPSIGGASLYTIDPATAQATLVGSSGFTETNGGGLAISSSSIIYGTPLTPNFGTYDATTGAFTNIAAPTLPNGRGYGALSFNGAVLYGLEVRNNTTGAPPHLVTIDTTTSAVTDLGTTAADFLDGLAFKPSAAAGVPGDYNSNGVVDEADYVLWRNSVGQSTLPNRGSGITGPVGVADYNFWRSHFANTSGSGAGGLSNSPVPEPGTLLLLGVSLLGILSTRRAKSK